LHSNERSMFDFAEKLNPNHYIGQALSINVYDEKDNLLCNESCLKSRFEFNVYMFNAFFILLLQKCPLVIQKQNVS
jgi:hypothetical protein